MVEITDEESARNWLKGQAQNVQIGFAARCALRALPGLGTDEDETLGELALPAIRAILTSGVAAVSPTPKVEDAADAAALSALSTTATDAATHSAASAALSAQAAATLSAASAACSNDAGRATSDGIETLFSEHLWPTEEVPPFFEAPLAKLSAFWDQDRATWGFWARWYDGMLHGAPMDWEVQQEVALIPDEVWTEGPTAVAREIEKIEAKYDLLSKIENFEGEDTAQVNRRGIGGNNPPTEINDPAIIREITIIWDVVHDLKEEVQEETPSKAKIERLADLLSASLTYLLHLCGRLGEHALKVGVTLAVTAGGAKIFKPELLEAVIEAAKRFLSSGAAG